MLSKNDMNNNKHLMFKILLWKLKLFFLSLRGEDKSWSGMLTLSITFAALIISWSGYQSSVRDSRTDLYISFKERFHDLRENPPDYKAVGFDSTESDQIKYFKSYWNLAFDEWYATNKLFTIDDSVLWDDYYSDAIKDALKHSYYRQSFCYLWGADELSFRAEMKGFIGVLNNLFKKNHNMNLEQYCKCIS